MDMMTTDESPSQISDKIKEILFNKSAERVDAFKTDVANGVFGDVDVEDEELDDESLSNSQMSEYSSMNSEDEIVNSTIYNFPVQMICLEKLENTLIRLKLFSSSDIIFLTIGKFIKSLSVTNRGFLIFKLENFFKLNSG